MELNVTQAEIDLFKKDLWKDVRKLVVTEHEGNKTIRRYADGVTSIESELAFLNFLIAQNPSWNLPRILNSDSEFIEFEYLNGIRLFNFIIELRYLYLIEKSEKAMDILERIKKIMTAQLLDFQKITEPWCEKIKTNYPFVEKCLTPIQVISNMLSLKYDESEIKSDIEIIATIVSNNSTALFRDATPKNAILNLPQFYYTNFKDDAERRILIRVLVDSDFFTDELLTKSIYQFDFTGCVYLCPKVDDLIAINLHESMMWAKSSEQFYKSNYNEKIFLATMFVRFLRFGGRKLSYRLLHKEGHIIRFRFDLERYYFEKLREVIQRMQNLKMIKGDSLVEVMKTFETATDIIPIKDYFGKPINYYGDIYPN